VSLPKTSWASFPKTMKRPIQKLCILFLEFELVKHLIRDKAFNNMIRHLIRDKAFNNRIRSLRMG
jgi:hypothetical protein